MLLTLCAALLAALPAQGGGTMTQSPLPDDVFWSADPAAALAKAVPAQPGLAVYAPARVDLAARQTLPALLRRKALLADDAAAPLPRFGVLFALDPRTDRAAAALAAPPPHGEAEFHEPDAKTLKKMMAGMTTQTLVADARRLLGVPWRAGEIMLLAFAGPARSQPVRVALEGSADGAGDFGNEIEAAVSRDEGRASPAIPGQTGIALAFEAKRHELHGAYRLGAEQAVHLVFCGRRFPAPFVVRVPAGAERFTLDVSKARLPAQKYRVWAVGRDAVAGPADVTVPPVR